MRRYPPNSRCYLKAAVYINGQLRWFDVTPTAVSSRTLVPLRAIVKALGTQLTWDAEHGRGDGHLAVGDRQLPVGPTEVRYRAYLHH